jgi:rhamnose utilization protein RhaD (predicted bifunctional aldolase and dehydrogenase)
MKGRKDRRKGIATTESGIQRSLWNDAEAAGCSGELALRAYTSRLLGQDKSLALHGGGNTSVKIGGHLYVKSSGSDLAKVSERDFIGLDLECVRGIFSRHFSDRAEMMHAMEKCISQRSVPRQPSVETLMHAAMPCSHVEHTHAYALLAAANVARIEQVVPGIYGELAPLVPYRHSGSALARQCVETLRNHGGRKTIGLVLAFHGAVAFGHTARESYENMILLAELAEKFLRNRGAWELPCAGGHQPPLADRRGLAALRKQVSRAAGFPLIMRTFNDPLCRAFACRDDVDVISQQGPCTPQHAIYTKRIPLVGRNIEDFARRYSDYLRRNLGEAALDRIDPAPRIVLDPEFGLCALGVNADCAEVAAELYRRDIEVISRASAHDIYRSAPEQDIAMAELEYGGFESTLRAAAGTITPLLGQVAMVTDAALQADTGLIQKLRDQGAAIVQARTADPCHVLDDAVSRFGGIDLAFAVSGDNLWRDAVAELLDQSPVDGRIITIDGAA